ncbi:MAG: PQQ-dependent sugar dehydrogenase [Caldilineaceae bacterium]
MIRVACCVLALCLVGGCAPPPIAPTPPAAATAVNGLTVAPGYGVEAVATGFNGPTQMILGPDDRLWIAQINGNENAGNGQIVALDLTSQARTVLVEGLLKPTGIALVDNALWIATRRELNHATLQPDGTVGAVEPILTELPFNGRSNGTLTVTPDGLLLFETSGARQGNAAAPGSATLWQLNPADPANPQAHATGLKGAYGHAFDAAGRLWTTEIGDDLVNSAAPPDELNLVLPGADFGWPQCFGNQEAATNYGGTAAGCQETRAPVALFEPRSTPTSIVASPWATDTLLIALWLQTTVAQVTVTPEGDNATGVVEPLITGLRNPQHLLVLDDGSVLVSEFATGTIYRITKES